MKFLTYYVLLVVLITFTSLLLGEAEPTETGTFLATNMGYIIGTVMTLYFFVMVGCICHAKSSYEKRAQKEEREERAERKRLKKAKKQAKKAKKAALKYVVDEETDVVFATGEFRKRYLLYD